MDIIHGISTIVNNIHLFLQLSYIITKIYCIEYNGFYVEIVMSHYQRNVPLGIYKSL